MSEIPPHIGPMGRGIPYVPPPSPQGRAAPPWKIWESLLVLGVFAVSLPLISLAGSLLMSFLLPESMGREEAEGEIIKYVLPAAIFFSHAFAWSGLYVLIVFRHRLSFLDGLGLRSLARMPILRAFGAGLLLQVAGVVVVELLAGTFPPPEDLGNPILRFFALGPWAVALLFFMAVVMAPLLEEALFRGMLFPALRGRMRFLPAALLVTGLFTALHGVQTSGYWPALSVIFVCGWFLAWLKERTGTLWPAIAFHMGFNFTALVLQVLQLLVGEMPLE